MKHKRLVIMVSILLLAGVGVFVSSKWRTFFPSRQMKELRQLEASLNLPKPKYRSEVDQGQSKDWKGVSSYERHISLSFEDISVFNSMRTELLKTSWKEEQGDGSSGSTTHFKFVKGFSDKAQCISGYTGPIDSDGVSLYISLKASGEYGCNFPAQGI